MAARRGVVIDRHGNVVDDDEGVLRDGQKLHVPAFLMDSTQRAVARAVEDEDEDGDEDGDGEELTDAEAAEQRRAQAYAAFRDRVGASGMRRHRVVTEFPDGIADEDRPAVAYHQMKQRLGTRKTKRQRKPADPEWLR